MASGAIADLADGSVGKAKGRELARRLLTLLGPFAGLIGVTVLFAILTRDSGAFLTAYNARTVAVHTAGDPPNSSDRPRPEPKALPTENIRVIPKTPMPAMVPTGFPRTSLMVLLKSSDGWKGLIPMEDAFLCASIRVLTSLYAS